MYQIQDVQVLRHIFDKIYLILCKNDENILYLCKIGQIDDNLMNGIFKFVLNILCGNGY